MCSLTWSLASIAGTLWKIGWNHVSYGCSTGGTYGDIKNAEMCQFSSCLSGSLLNPASTVVKMRRKDMPWSFPCSAKCKKCNCRCRRNPAWSLRPGLAQGPVGFSCTEAVSWGEWLDVFSIHLSSSVCPEFRQCQGSAEFVISSSRVSAGLSRLWWPWAMQCQASWKSLQDSLLHHGFILIYW